jgi:hypothetical protein
MGKLGSILLFTLLSFTVFSQEDINFFYGDTVLEVNHLKIETKGAMSYRDRFKTGVWITNLSDSFKIIDPVDVKLTYNERTAPIHESKLKVIPPKTTRKFRFTAQGSDFKSNRLKATISKISTTGKVESVYSPKEFVLDAAAVKAIDQDQFPVTAVGPLQLKLKSFNYKGNGTLVVKVAVAYNSDRFLGMNVKKIKLLTSNGKTLVNMKQTARSLYYYKERKEIVLGLEFENPYGYATSGQADRLVFDDVFVEYNTNGGTDKQEIGFIKKGEGKGNPPKEEKEKDIEVIED